MALGYVVPLKSLLKLGPRHLVVGGESGGEAHPPGTREPAKLLGREQHLLDVRAAKEPKLSLDRAKTVISLQRIH
jgi:hypothetical protein